VLAGTSRALGIITRCPQTMAQDTVTQDVQLLSTDQYCLNGNRLRLTSGTQGATGSNIARSSRLTRWLLRMERVRRDRSRLR